MHKDYSIKDIIKIIVDTCDLHNKNIEMITQEYMFDAMYKLNDRIERAIEKYENCKEEDYCTLVLDMYDILRGEENESNRFIK